MIEHLTLASASAFGVRQVCAALGVMPSSFYAHKHKDVRPRRQEDRALTASLEVAFEQSGHTYGSPRLVRALRAQGLHTAKTRVRRLMKEAHLCPRQKRRVRVKTTHCNPHLPLPKGRPLRIVFWEPCPPKNRDSGFTVTSLTSRLKKAFCS